MKKFFFLVLLPISLLFFFISGYLPYTLIFNNSSLKNAKYTAAEAVTAQSMRCKVLDDKGSQRGIRFETTFSGNLRNNTDRFIAISAIGEVFSSAGQLASTESEFFVLFPKTAKQIQFTSSTIYSRTSGYKCKLRYAIGSVQHW